jgi:hypothetical protein
METIMARGDARKYWEEQLAEYWDAGFSVAEYCELKELPRESVKRWIRIFKKEREAASAPQEKDEIELVEVKQPRTSLTRKSSGIRLKAGGVEILLEKDFDSSCLTEVLKVLGTV